MWIRFDSRGVGFPEGQRAGMPRNANDRRRFLDSDSSSIYFASCRCAEEEASSPLSPSYVSPIGITLHV